MRGIRNSFLSHPFITVSRVRFLLVCSFAFSTFAACGQSVTVSGTVVDNEQRLLPLANLVILPDSIVVTTDGNGTFRSHCTAGQKRFIASYTGFESVEFGFPVHTDTTLVIQLKPRSEELEPVIVSAERYSSEDLVQSTRTSTTVLSQRDINAIPVLGGEADVLKTLQLLPGTVRGVEGSADLFVRGGAADQNLVLLDGAPVYNTSHLFGFVSVFNPDILKTVEAIHGGFPATYAGRLSSILDIQTLDEAASETRFSGDVGLIATRLFLEQPLVKDKLGIWVAGRRTYIDRVAEIAGESLPYYFYDLNGKITLRASEYSKLELSFYHGEDLLDIFRDRNRDGYGFVTAYESRNRNQSLRWSRSSPSGIQNIFMVARTGYDYDIHNRFDDNQFGATSDINDVIVRWSIRHDSLRNGGVHAGMEWIRHNLSPSVVSTEGTIAELIGSSTSRGLVSHELGAFASREFLLKPRVLVNAGLRLSAGISDNSVYVVPEPRLHVRYSLAGDESLKLSYSRMAQYMHRISNSAVTTPADLWYTVTDKIDPQTAHQVSVAWQRFVPTQSLFLSIETYYKSMQNLIGYEEGTNLFFNTDFESKLVQGRGKATGFEVLARKEAGRFTGWISYTLSWSRRQFDSINGGQWFRARYDRRHNGAIVGQYALSDRWSLSLVWEFISGARFTPVVGKYAVIAPTHSGVDLIPIYAGVNEVGLADTHRLDIGVKFRSPPERKFQWHWFAGIYNVYNRASPVGVVVEQDETDGSLRYVQPGLFGLIPFVSYGFKM